MTATVGAPRAAGPGFSAAIREQTRELHDQVNQLPYIEALLSGSLDIPAYATLAVQHLFIYSALEEVSARLADDEIARPFLRTELLRVPALRADLTYLLGEDWPGQAAALPETETLVSRIRQTVDWPGGLVAHHYVRYLGDLSGGRIVARRLADTYGLRGDGVRFYDFADIAKPKRFKDFYHGQLDAAPWTQPERNRILAEVVLAFQLNGAVLAALGRNAGVA